jgi:Bacterial TniB protein
MNAPDKSPFQGVIDVRKRLEDLVLWQEEWRAEEAYLDQLLAAIGDSTREVDIQKSAEIGVLRNRLELQQVRIPLEISPDAIKAIGYVKLRQQMVSQFVQLSQEEQLKWLNNFLFIMTHDLRRLNEKIARVRGYRSFGQKRNFLLGAVSGMGKTTFLNWFASNYLPQKERERNHVPIIMIDAPEGNSPKPLFQRIIRACGASYLERDTEEMLINKTAHYFQKCGVEVLIIDEVEHIKYHSVRRRLLELSNLTHHVPIICSSCNPQEWIEDDPEIEGRWNDYFRIERYTGARLQQLLIYINLLLPLPQDSFLSSNPKKKASAEREGKNASIAFVQRVTRGKLGNIMLLIREATRAAIEGNLPCLEETLLRQTWDNIQPPKEEE